MRLLNSVLATIFAFALIVSSAVGVVYLLGIVSGADSATALVDSWLLSLRSLDNGKTQAILIGIALISLTLFVLEVRPWRPRFLVAAESGKGKTYIQRSDIESYLLQRLSKEKALSPEHVGLRIHRDKFDVAANVSVSTLADTAVVREQVGRVITGNLKAIGLGSDLGRVDTRVQRIKRAA